MYLQDVMILKIHDETKIYFVDNKHMCIKIQLFISKNFGGK